MIIGVDSVDSSSSTKEAKNRIDKGVAGRSMLAREVRVYGRDPARLPDPMLKDCVGGGLRGELRGRLLYGREDPVVLMVVVRRFANAFTRRSRCVNEGMGTLPGALGQQMQTMASSRSAAVRISSRGALLCGGTNDERESWLLAGETERAGGWVVAQSTRCGYRELRHPGTWEWGPNIAPTLY